MAAVVLRVDSPGGSALASDLIWRETVRESGPRKPIVVSMGDVAASGGYYISAGADAIFARPGTITGSIGIYGGKFDLSGLYEKIGYNVVRIERGRFAGSLSETRGFTEEERARLREVLQQGYDMFVGRVAAGRGMSYEAVDAIGRGRVWTGEQALERGLVDRLGGLMDAVEEARRLAGLGSRRVEIVRLPETSFGPADLTVGRIVKETASVLGLSDHTEASPVQELTLLQPLRDTLVHWEILSRLAGEQRFCLIEPALLPPREPW